MISFKVLAPGKLILYGEHAVVYGKTALAASLNLRTCLEFEELPGDQLNLHLSMPKINLQLQVPLKQISDHFFQQDSPKYGEADHDSFYARVRQFVQVIGYVGAQQKMGLEAFFYLFVAVSQSEGLGLKPFKVHVDTMLSIGAGLGSSACLAVCLATCFIRYSHRQKGLTTVLDNAQLTKISGYALECERIMHGAPSGVDNTVCTFGSVVEFRKGEVPKPVVGGRSMRVLLVYTRVPRSTKVLVERVAGLKRRYPGVFEPILDSIDAVAKEALEVIKRMRDLPDDDREALRQAYEELMTLMGVNQGLLSSCEVSHPSLDAICAEAKKHSLRAKLTGAGGGGYAYILLPPDTSEETISAVSEKLSGQGYDVTLTNLGGPGVQIED